MEMLLKKIYSLLGLAQRAGKISSGYEIIQKDIKKNNTKLLVFSVDLAEDVKKNLLFLCKKFNVNAVFLCEKTLLGECIGKTDRVALSVNDQGFADAVIKEVRLINDSTKTLNHLEVVEWQK